MQHNKTEQKSAISMTVEEYKFFTECEDIMKPVNLASGKFADMYKRHQKLLKDFEMIQKEFDELKGDESSAVLKGFIERGNTIKKELKDYLEKHPGAIAQEKVFSTDDIIKLFNPIKNPGQKARDLKDIFISAIKKVNEYRGKILKQLDDLTEKKQGIVIIIDCMIDQLVENLDEIIAEEKPQLVAEIKKDNPPVIPLNNIALKAEEKTSSAETKNSSKMNNPAASAVLFKQAELNKKDLNKEKSKGDKKEFSKFNS